MSIRTPGIPDTLYQYLVSSMLNEPEILQELRVETAKLPLAQMQISVEQGQFMQFLIQLIGAKKTLDIGTFTGYSALAVALALPDNGCVIACDVNAETTAIAAKFWQLAGVSSKVQLRLAPAIDTLVELINEGMAGTFDFIFIDADKSAYDHYYEKSLQLLRVGGLIAIDNVFLAGKVADININDNRTKVMRMLNSKIKDDPRVMAVTVPMSDGLTLVCKKGI